MHHRKSDRLDKNKTILLKIYVQIDLKKVFTKKFKNQFETLYLTRGQKWLEINSEEPF